jgi:micrococcal nuclease
MAVPSRSPSPRYSHRPTRRIVALVILVLVVAIRAVWELASPGPPDALESGMYEVERVVDGDTLLLTSRARLRLQGVDTPETKKEDHPVEPWGPEAAAFTQAFIEDAAGRVRIEFGPERKDRYGRFLGFVFHDDRLLNEELVREGLARATTQYHFSASMKRRLEKAEDEARAAGRGIWSAE